MFLAPDDFIDDRCDELARETKEKASTKADQPSALPYDPIAALDEIVRKASTLEIEGGHSETFAIRRLADLVAELATIVRKGAK